MEHKDIIKGSQVAIVTPMNDDGSIDWESTQGLVEWHIREGSDGLVVAGTTGESATLSPKEHKELISFIIKQVDKRVPVIAGTGSNSTDEAIELSAYAKQAGADAVLLVVPYYNKPTQQGLIKHFSKIAEEVDVPQILYNVPSRTITDMLPQTVEEVAQFKNIIGIKEASGDVSRVATLRKLCGESFIILSGDDPTCCELILAGGNGCISVTANVAPALMHELCALAQEGKSEQARALQQRLMPLHDVLFLESNPIPVKHAIHLKHKIGTKIRLPLTNLSLSHEPQLKSVMHSLALLD